MSEGKLFVISGPSGVGKGTALEIAMKRKPDLSFSVSATTRAPRPGEVEGKSYTFINKTFYGTPRAQLAEKRARGPVFLDIDPMGAKRVRQAVPDCTLIFIMPPSMEELERRLRGRGDTSEEQIQIRLARAQWEIDQAPWYDYVVVNRKPEQCADEILNIIG